MTTLTINGVDFVSYDAVPFSVINSHKFVAVVCRDNETYYHFSQEPITPFTSVHGELVRSVKSSDTNAQPANATVV